MSPARFDQQPVKFSYDRMHSEENAKPSRAERREKLRKQKSKKKGF